MNETRQLLKIFGVAVTDFETEAQKLEANAAQLTAAGGKEEITKLLKDASELCAELDTQWLEVTQRIFQRQIRLQHSCADAAARLGSTDLATEIESARMEAGE